jgi:5-methylcytosine-specific restriction enzyme A
MIKGEKLNKQYNIGAVQARYREDGRWYHPLEKFPGVLFDASGYVLFKTAMDYANCASVRKGPDPNHIHIEGGIATLPIYVQLNPPPRQSGS